MAKRGRPRKAVSETLKTVRPALTQFGIAKRKIDETWKKYQIRSGRNCIIIKTQSGYIKKVPYNWLIYRAGRGWTVSKDNYR